MSVEKRIRMSLLAEKMKKQKRYSEKLGLEDISVFRGRNISGAGRTRQDTFYSAASAAAADTACYSRTVLYRTSGSSDCGSGFPDQFSYINLLVTGMQSKEEAARLFLLLAGYKSGKCRMLSPVSISILPAQSDRGIQSIVLSPFLKSFVSAFSYGGGAPGSNPVRGVWKREFYAPEAAGPVLCCIRRHSQG